MRIPKNIPNELKRLINAIVKHSGDCENWLKGYNRATWTYTWHGSPMTCEPLFCSYGCIGYSINYKGYAIDVDNDLSQIEIKYYYIRNEKYPAPIPNEITITENNKIIY